MNINIRRLLMYNDRQVYNLNYKETVTVVIFF